MSRILLGYLMVQFAVCAYANEGVSQGIAQRCMEQFLADSEDIPKNAKKQSAFVSVGDNTRGLETFLAEAILTASFGKVPFAVALGGTTDSQSMAEAVRLSLDSVAKVLAEDTEERSEIFIVYFTTEKDVRYFERVAEEHGVRFIHRLVDIVTWEGIRNADCGFCQ